MACPIILGDLAFSIADAAYGYARQSANEAFGISLNALGALGDFTFEPILFTTGWNFGGSLEVPGTITAPTVNPSQMQFQHPGQVPAAPTSNVARAPAAAAPTFTEQFPSLAWASAPNLIALSDPGPSPDIDLDVDLPVPPDYPLPTVPTLDELNSLDAPTIQLPEFQGQRPVFDAPFPDEDFNFTPQAYVSTLMAQVQTVIEQMLAGEPLPAAVAAALRARAYVQADIEESRAVQQAFDEFAARGFDEPTGPLNRRIEFARQGARDARQALNRDIYIRDTETAIESRRLAVQQGIVAEGQLMQMHVAMQQLTLAAAQYARDTAIAILNARVSVFNAQVQAYEADARVFRDLIGAELAKVELFRAQIQAEQLRGDLNQQRLNLYLAQLQGARSLVDLYLANLTGARTRVEIEQAKIEAFRTRVQVLETQVRAQAGQWDGFRTRNEGNVARMRGFEILSNTFATRVQAWGQGEQVKTDIARFDVDLARLRQDDHRARLETYRTELQTELGRIQALAQVLSSQTGVFDAQVRQVIARGDAKNRVFMSQVERERARTDVELKKADQQLEQFRHVTALMVQVQQSIAQIGAQIGSAAQSAVNVSTGISAGTSRSQSCNDTFITQE